MRKTSYIFHILILSLLLALEAGGQMPYPRFKHFNSNDGMSQNTVYSILQDSLGFVWLGTKDGLNRFDGSKFDVYRVNIKGVPGDNVFRRIVQDGPSTLWLGTEDGVYRYDMERETFESFAPEAEDGTQLKGIVNDMLMDGEDDLWISIEEKGLFCYHKESDRLNHYHIPTLHGGLPMITICVGKNNEIWAFPYNRPFVRVNKRTGQVMEFALEDDPDLLHNLGEVWKVVEDQYNTLLVASSTKGLVSINTITRKHKILLENVNEYGDPIFVRCFERVDPSHLWIGSESGLYIYNTDTEEIENYRHDYTIPHSISDNAIYSITKDEEGGVWLGTYFGGVNYYSPRQEIFETFYPIPELNHMKGARVREFCDAPNGNIWIGTEDAGLNLFDPKSAEFLPLPKPLENLYTNVHALYTDGEDLWISTFNRGILRYHIPSGRMQSYHATGDSASISNNTAFVITKDLQGTLWLGTLSGLNRYDPVEDRFYHIPGFEGVFVQDIMEDRDGTIWVCTFGKGLFRYTPSTQEWKNYPTLFSDKSDLRLPKLTDIMQDAKGNIWVGTEGMGLFRYLPESDSFKNYESKDGLPNNVVFKILDDDYGNLWLSTNAGLVRMDLNNQTIENYTVENGLRINQFNYRSGYVDDDGYLYFGSIEGFVRFKPSLIQNLRTEAFPPIYFTGLTVNNQEIVPGGKSGILKSSLLATDHIKLRHSQNSFVVHYRMPDFDNHFSGRMVYRLQKGYANEWTPAPKDRKLIFSNLPSGKYQLQVALLRSDGNPLEDSIRTLTMQVKPPFYLSPWAWIVYALIALAGLQYAVYTSKMKERSAQRKKSYLYRQEKERELYRSKIDFFTNVAHEIRTPLSLIKGPMDYLRLKFANNKELQETLNMMSGNVERLLNLVNQLLDFRKADALAYSIHLRAENVVALTQSVIRLFRSKKEIRDIHFETSFPENALFAMLDREAYVKILTNLLGNAFKFCDHTVAVQIEEVSHPEGTDILRIVVLNDGELVGPHLRESIFDPFVHFDPNAQRPTPGTGIGLALSRSLTELQSGKIYFEERNGMNAFRVEFPTLPQSPEAVAPKSPNSVPVKSEELAPTAMHGDEPSNSLLLVEDDMELLSFETNLLKEKYTIFRATNGEEALQILSTHSIHLVISDVMMPVMDGFALTDEIKSRLEFSHIPVILLTAKTTDQARVEGIESGADAYIDKPFSVEVLLATIANLLQSREHLRELYLKYPMIGATSITSNSADREFITKLHEIVMENLSNSDFNVDSIAEEFNMSRASFYRKIKGVLSLSPSEYIRLERLKKAARLLKENKYKINEICYMVGFNSPSYFTKCFQQQFGVLPKDFA